VSGEAGLYAQLIGRRAGVADAATAVKHHDDVLSYSELAALALKAAALLKEEGVGAGDRVTLMLENSIEYVSLLLGVWAAGAVAVPLNADTTGEAASKTLGHARPRLVAARARAVDRLGLRRTGLRILEIGPRFSAFRERLEGLAPAEAAEVRESEPAMLLYTSGTTGAPKGVVLSHANLLANTRSIVEYLRLNGSDSIVNVLPFFHSFGNSVLLTHLAAGARVVIENRFAFPAKVVETMQRERPTGFAGVPATYYILLHRSHFADHNWEFLRYICQAGGGMRVETIERLRKIMPATEIVIMYGQTEASARLSYLPPAMLERKLGSIGIGIPGVELKVAGEDGQELPAGETGELLARGQNVMLGYADDPEATKEAIVDGWLRTGDMAWRDQDGYFFIVSRKSDFIKSASYRVSPGEIEEVIAGWGGIEDAAVIGVEDQLLGEAICACVVCPPERFDAEAIRRHCQERLPTYKVPRWVVLEPEIPRTASGKKQYFKLREKYRDLEKRASAR
jgi:acyl-CoA synthetase (AMP-forming)/AMP-acid ligase II